MNDGTVRGALSPAAAKSSTRISRSRLEPTAL